VPEGHDDSEPKSRRKYGADEIGGGLGLGSVGVGGGGDGDFVGALLSGDRDAQTICVFEAAPHTVAEL